MDMLTGNPAEIPQWLQLFGRNSPAPEFSSSVLPTLPVSPMAQEMVPQQAAPVAQQAIPAALPGAAQQVDPFMESIKRLIDLNTQAYQRVSSGQKPDRVTAILRERAAEKPSWDEIGQAISRSAYSTMSVLGNRNPVSVGEALNNIRANKILEAEKLARVQIADEQAQRQFQKDTTHTIVELVRLGEQKRHNMELEKKFDDYDKKTAALKSAGLNDEEVASVLTGRYGVQMDPFGNTVVWDKANAKVIRQSGPNMPLPPAQPTSSVPGGVDLSSGAGIQGVGGRIINRAAGLLNVEPPAPQTQKSDQFWAALDVKTRSAVQSLEGFRPSVYISKLIGDLTFDPTDPTLGRQGGLNKISQLKRTIDSELEYMKGVAGSGGLRPDKLSAANLAVQQLSHLSQEYAAAINSYAGARDSTSLQEVQAVRTASQLRQLLQGLDINKLPPDVQAAIEAKLSAFGY